MKASITHFSEIVRRIEANSWWAANIGGSPQRLWGFSYEMDSNEQTITEVPTEPLESLLLHVRKLTMNDAPEQLLKVKKALKGEAKAICDQELLDVWQKYWRLAFVMPQFTYENGAVKEFMTPYHVYECFINGRLFHSNDPVYNQILHGSSVPSKLSQPHLLLQNAFHLTVTNLCLAAIGLQRYIDNGYTFADIVLSTKPIQALEFVFYRKKVAEMDAAYREANNQILAGGGESNCRWA
jgi:hypothetical protein